MPRASENETVRGMPPELELVIRSTRAKNPENDNQIRALLNRGLNWSEVVACANQHKVAPLVQERVADLDTSGIAADQKHRLMELARDTGISNFAYMGEMLWLCGVFEAAGVPAIPFKGPALGWLAYENFTHRTCVDLDFVLPQRYIPEAIAALQAREYTPQFNPIEAQARERGPAPGQYLFTPVGRRRSVELHTERTLRYFSRPLNLNEMNSRLVELEIGGQKIRTFSIEDLLVMLCVHGAKHFWERLSWIVDIAQLVTVQQVNWEFLLAIAARMQSTQVLLLGLSLAHELVGAPLPPTVLERIRGNSQVQWLTGKVLEQYSGTSYPGAGVWARAIFRVRSSDGPWQGLRQLVRLSLSPTESDRQKIRLPAVLSPLYSPVRLLRLLGEYGLGLRRRVKTDLAAYEPTPPEVVDQVLRFAKLSARDVLYDLGCGDGRIVVAAAEKYGIRAVGVDIDPARIAEARANARQHGVEKHVEFVLADARDVDVSEATVVNLYLKQFGILRLVERLRSQLRCGSRVISRSSPIYGWTPDHTEKHVSANGIPSMLYLWTIKEADKETAVEQDAAGELRHQHKADG
ncbi:MAG TPA: nucleotidyltransferase family protein [Bryobacteraceae bacterium]|nr:nucleotidyltransferase family protein [Bryobacteraceae bacterium]